MIVIDLISFTFLHFLPIIRSASSVRRVREMPMSSWSTANVGRIDRSLVSAEDVDNRLS